MFVHPLLGRIRLKEKHSQKSQKFVWVSRAGEEEEGATCDLANHRSHLGEGRLMGLFIFFI